MREPGSLGPKVRTLRRRASLTQAQLAERLGISPSYLNLIEHGRRPMPAALLLRLAQQLDVDVRSLSADADARTAADLLEAFGDPLFETHELTAPEVRELAASAPAVARAVLALYHAYRAARETADSLASRVSEKLAGLDLSRLPTEEVSDLLQRHLNHFPELEDGAEALWREVHLEREDLSSGLARHLADAHGVKVVVERTGAMAGATRRYDAERRVLQLSEALRRGSRNFQLAYQIGLLAQAPVLDRLASDPLLTSEESRALARVALAGYFAGAVLMPYQRFLDAARSERYDVELLGHRFRTSFEQTCHRLTTLRRPGAEGVPFHMVRVDIAGNISKRFSASGFRIARFSGACPRWNVFDAFLTPGMIRPQLARMPDGTTFFSISRTVRRQAGGYHSPLSVLAIALGCEVSHARQLVYSDGVNLDSEQAVVPIGTTCRVCERMDCEQRAFPPLQHPLTVNANVRGVSFFAPVAPR
jgi:predicted transcriptional regulator/transcriptional regulator with XRE-family HTH domain